MLIDEYIDRFEIEWTTSDHTPAFLFPYSPMSHPPNGQTNVFADWANLLESFKKAAQNVCPPQRFNSPSDELNFLDFMSANHAFQSAIIGLQVRLKSLEDMNNINNIPEKWISDVQHELDQFDAYTTDELAHIFATQQKTRCVTLSERLKGSLTKISSLDKHRPGGNDVVKTAGYKPDSYKPTDWVESAHNSIMKALDKCNVCDCEPPHTYRVALKTHRQCPESKKCSVSIFVRAIGSWQETMIKAERVLSKETSVGITIEETDFDSWSEEDYADRVESLCKECLGACGPIECLSFIVKHGADDSLFRGQSEQCEWKWVDAISLQHLLERSDLQIGPAAQRVLLLLVSYGSLHFFNAPWLTEVWDSSRIVFPIKPGGIYLTPYLDTGPIFQANEQPDCVQQPQILQRPGPNEHFPFLVVLAISLLEIHKKQTFAVLARHCHVKLYPKKNGYYSYLTVRSVYKYLSENESDYWSQEDKMFYNAVWRCLDKMFWHRVADANVMRTKIYELVVQTLEQLYKGNIHDIDTLKELNDALPLPERDLQLVEDFPSPKGSSTQEVAQSATTSAARKSCDTEMRGLAGDDPASHANSRGRELAEHIQSRSTSQAIAQMNIVDSETRESTLKIRFFDDHDSPQPQSVLDVFFGRSRMHLVNVY